MSSSNIVYLSLGSNLGNRLNSLQQAVFHIATDIGNILAISAVYTSEAWGFTGGPFLNACVAVETFLKPAEVLRRILNIETAMGRKRTKEGSYQSRTLDIDLLYYGGDVVSSEELTLPHPSLHERKFVLKPLADIAPQFYHPVLGKDSRNLLQQCRDSGKVEKTEFHLYKNRSQLFSQLHFMAIEGNIGAGKTSLAKKIATQFNAKVVLERFADNPFLPKFYEDQSRYAFPLEMSFLADRYQQFTDDTSQFDLFKNFMISDYDIFKSLIFAQITLQKEEFGLYRKVFNFMYQVVHKPGMYIYLYQTPERLLQNIKKRGRDYEQQIQADYLEKINRGYMDFIKGNPQQKSLIIDVSELDFVSNEEDYNTILDRIQAHIVGK